MNDKPAPLRIKGEVDKQLSDPTTLVHTFKDARLKAGQSVHFEMIDGEGWLFVDDIATGDGKEGV